MIPYKHRVIFSRLAILQLLLLRSNSDILVKSKVLPSQWSTFVHYQLSGQNRAIGVHSVRGRA